MVGQKDIDTLVDSFIENEQTIQVNTSMVMRIMDSIQKGGEKKTLIPVWQGVAMVLSFALVTAVGIRAGSLHQSASAGASQTMVIFANDGTMEHFEFYEQTLKE